MRHALTLLAATLAACSGSPGPPPPPTQPGVEVEATAQEVLGTEFQVNVNVSGCSAVNTLTLSDHGHVLTTLSNASTSTQFTIHEQDLEPLYPIDGIAADLDLVASITCSDGLSAVSNGTGVSFMPADQVFSGTFSGTQFSIEPDGSGLVMCTGGQVVRYDTGGNVLQSTGDNLPYPCSDQGFLVRGVTNELYWVEPGTMFSRLDQNLDVLQTYAYAATSLYLPPNGAGFAIAEGAVGQGSDMYWVDRGAGATQNDFVLNGTVDGTPAFGQQGLVVPVVSGDSTNDGVSLEVEIWSLADGAPPISTTSLATLSAGSLGTATTPVISLSADGSTAYFVSGNPQNMAYACSINSPCTPPSGGLIFLQELSGGPYTAIVPVDSDLLAIGPQACQFLDGTMGTPIGEPIAPTGGLSLLYVVPGPSGSTYLLSGDSLGNILEVIILDAPAHEAARYTIATGGFGFDVDSSGRAYILEGQLASLLLPSDYASARQ